MSARSASSVKKIIAKLTAVAGTTLATAAVAATLGAAPASASTGNWIMTGWNVHLINQSDPATASHFFNTTNSYGTGPNAATSPISDGFADSGVLLYTSYAQFASDVANHAISSGYQWVMYDPEMWSSTPLNEQQNPAQYLQMFGQLAHANGYKVIESPARDLASVPGAACPMQPGDNLDRWFIRCNIAGAAAANADIVVIQDQVNTTNLTEFGNLYNTTRNQARAANPQIVVDVELSTNYGTADQEAAAAQSINADGYYISATQTTLSQADRFLQEMQAAGY
jgi:hypothetical protein